MKVLLFYFILIIILVLFIYSYEFKKIHHTSVFEETKVKETIKKISFVDDIYRLYEFIFSLILT
jgi:hypothetical protein